MGQCGQELNIRDCLLLQSITSSLYSEKSCVALFQLTHFKLNCLSRNGGVT